MAENEKLDILISEMQKMNGRQDKIDNRLDKIDNR